MEQKLNAWQPYALGLLRIVLGLVMLNFGLAKIFHFHAGVFMPPTGSMPWFAGLIELILGAALLIGLQTRLVAFVLSGEMAFAYFIAHFPKSFFPTENNGALAVSLCFAFLYLVTAGGGAFALTRK